MPNSNVHTLYIRNVPLCAICKRCGRRALVPVSKFCRWDGKGVMTPIYEIARRLKCETCNLRETHGFAPPDQEFAAQWVRQEIMETPGLD